MPDSQVFNKGDLCADFEQSSSLVDMEIIDKLHNDYYISALMNENDTPSIGGLRINQSGRKDNLSAEKSRKQQMMDQLILLDQINRRLADLENELERNYGKDFAENLAAEHLNEDTYLWLMSIEDQEQRRREIAKAINEGIEEGYIDVEEIYSNSDVQEWLELRASQEYYSASLNVENTHDVSLGNEEQELDNIFSDQSGPSI